MDENTRNRRYPRRLLRGRPVAHYSTRVRFPKFHIVEDCEGFSATPAEAREVHTFTSAAELGCCEWGRPCRMCTLESVLLTCLSWDADEKVFVTFTSQSNPRSADASPFSYDWNESTQSGKKRLQRVARKAHLPLVHTVSGPAAYGFVTTLAAEVIAHNLRSLVVTDQVTLPRSTHVECAWTLLGDNPPEIDDQTTRSGADSAWRTAELLSK